MRSIMQRNPGLRAGAGRSRVCTHGVRNSFVIALTQPSLERLKDYQDAYTAATQAAAESATKVTSAAAADFTDATSGLELTSLDSTPLLAGLAAGIIIVGTGIALVTRKSGPKIQGVSPARAIDILANDPAAVIIDLRSKAEVSEAGSPDLRSIRKSLVSLPYIPPAANASKEGTVQLGWEDKLRRLPRVSEESCIVLLSSTSADSSEAAKLAASVYPEQSAIYFVAGGTEGPGGWKESELPWREPLKLGFDLPQLQSIDFSGLKADAGTLAGVAAALGVAAGAVFLFAEIETILEVIGVFGAGQFLVSKLIFAEDRQKLFDDLKSLFNDKIGAGDAGEDLKKLASTILDVDTADEVIEKSTGKAANGKVTTSEPVAEPVAEKGDVPRKLPASAASASPTQSANVPKESAVASAPISQSVPQDVQEGSDWIEAGKRDVPKVGAVGRAPTSVDSQNVDDPENVKEAREWIESWKRKS